MQIGVMFTQITTTSVCLAIVQTLEAAVRWPDIVLVAAVACAVVAAVRTAAMGLVLAKYTPGSGKGTMALMGMRKGEGHIPWIDKLALTIVGGLLLPFSMPMTNPVSALWHPVPRLQVLYWLKLSAFQMPLNDHGHDKLC